jgi:hypothetical protein
MKKPLYGVTKENVKELCSTHKKRLLKKLSRHYDRHFEVIDRFWKKHVRYIKSSYRDEDAYPSMIHIKENKKLLDRWYDLQLKERELCDLRMILTNRSNCVYNVSTFVKSGVTFYEEKDIKRKGWGGNK